MAEVVAVLAPAMPGSTQEVQEQRAWTLLASIVGAVTIARALPIQATRPRLPKRLDCAAFNVLGTTETECCCDAPAVLHRAGVVDAEEIDGNRAVSWGDQSIQR